MCSWGNLNEGAQAFQVIWNWVGFCDWGDSYKEKIENWRITKDAIAKLTNPIKK